VNDFVAGIMAARRAAGHRRLAFAPQVAPPVSPPVGPAVPPPAPPALPFPLVSYPMSTTLDLPPSVRPPQAPWTPPAPGPGADARSNGHAHH
jgi:hypothetical protein